MPRATGLTPLWLAAFLLQPNPAVLRRLFEEGLQQRRQQYGESDARTAQAARDLGQFLAREGERPAAEVALAEAVRIDEAVFGGDARQTLEDVASMAAVSPPAQAEPLWRRAAGSPDPAVAARSNGALAQLAQATGDGQRAVDFYRRALSGQEAATGNSSAPVAVILNALAQAVGQNEGIPLLERALAIDRQRLGARHPETASTEANLAGMLLNAGRADECIRAIRDAMEIFEESLGPDHPRTATACMILGWALRAKGDRVGAGREYRRAVEIERKAFGPEHPQTLADAQVLEEFLRSAPRPQRR
jgi:tetratricopeptide (TPR) repeat protein